MSQEDKRLQIYGMRYLPISNAQVENMPGSHYIRVHGDWIDLGISSGEFKEQQEEPGSIVVQELKAIITDTGQSNAISILDLISSEGLVLIEMTNGDKKVIGTDHFPVLISSEHSGSSLKQSLSFKRNSPEPAKILKSF